MDKRNDRTGKPKKPFKFIAILLLIIALGGITWKVVDKYVPNFKQISIRSVIPEWSKEGTVIMLKDTPIGTDNPPIEQDGKFYLPVEFVKQYVDKYIFWEENSKRLTITTQDKVIRMKTDDLTAYVNNDVLSLDLPIEIKNGTAYMPVPLLESLYDIAVTYDSSTDILMIDYTDEATNMGTVSQKKVSVRDQPNIKNGIVAKLNLNDELTIYSETDKWTKIRTKSGIVGYILTKDIGNLSEVQPKPKDLAVQKEIWKPQNGKINMVWDQVFKVESSADSNRIKTQKGLDVLSPTWFSIEDNEGNIKNIANKTYVEWAHKQGYQVWPLVDNQFNGTLTHEVLSNPDTREKIIKQLLALAALYDLDGINIDFESIKEADGDYYLQFIRELTPFFKEQGIIVSVDVYVPKPWTQHYQRDELAKIVDYIAVMAYDEHWSTSPESGSVASIGWVRQGITDSLEQQIPPEKLIMGVPYFTRLWTETLKDGKIEVSSKAYSMSAARKILSDNNVEPVWDEETAQYYGEFAKGDITYKIWLEDKRSIEEKLKLVEEYNLAGISGWKRGLESDDIWDVLHQNLKQ